MVAINPLDQISSIMLVSCQHVRNITSLTLTWLFSYIHMYMPTVDDRKNHGRVNVNERMNKRLNK